MGQDEEGLVGDVANHIVEEEDVETKAGRETSMEVTMLTLLHVHTLEVIMLTLLHVHAVEGQIVK